MSRHGVLAAEAAMWCRVRMAKFCDAEGEHTLQTRTKLPGCEREKRQRKVPGGCSRSTALAARLSISKPQTTCGSSAIQQQRSLTSRWHMRSQLAWKSAYCSSLMCGSYDARPSCTRHTENSAKERL